MAEQVVDWQVSLWITLWPANRGTGQHQRLQIIGLYVAVDRVAVPGLEREDLASLLGEKALCIPDSRVKTLHRANLGDEFGIADLRRQPLAVSDRCA